jgi:hypothetical protein
MLRARGGAAEDQDRLEGVVISRVFIVGDGVRALCGWGANNRHANNAIRESSPALGLGTRI